jgi:L-seryl-tRNA(Ser) seleniumtransferase
MMNPDDPVNQGPAVAPGGASDPRRALPAVDRLARAVIEAHEAVPPWAANEAARRVLDAARADLAAAQGADRAAADGGPAAAPGLAALTARAAEAARALAQPRPSRVVNATGVVLHTNLGRAVLGPGAARAVAEAALAYSDLELEPASGRRGNRLGAVSGLLARLAGAEAALAVNNNAAATLLALDTLARGREVVVSRGELVEIGGSFRVPEILERAGVRLVEVGTTNRTHPDDYRRAIGPATAVLLKVHRSNFEMRGFTAEVSLAELVAIGRERGVAVIEDLGSGSLVDLAGLGLPPEHHVAARVAAGADCICFSGDKLLGGPQAGLVVGRRDAVEAMRRSPLARALRLDKLSLAALDWTLRALAEGRDGEIPTLRQLREPLAVTRARAEALAERLAKVASGAPGLEVGVASDRAAVGGGTLPGFELATAVVTLRAPQGAERLAAALRADRLAAALRAAAVPVMSRIRDDAVLLDARTLLDGDEAAIETAVREALVALRGARSSGAAG